MFLVKIAVAPHVGVWIEIIIENAGLMGVPSRSPCGSVD